MVLATPGPLLTPRTRTVRLASAASLQLQRRRTAPCARTATASPLQATTISSLEIQFDPAASSREAGPLLFLFFAPIQRAGSVGYMAWLGTRGVEYIKAAFGFFAAVQAALS